MRSTVLRNLAITAFAVIAAIWLITLIPGPARHINPPLPPHVLVMPQEKFLLAPGYGAYAKILCYDPRGYSLTPGYKAFNGWFVLSCDSDGTHNFSYPHSKEWSYAAP